MVQVPYEQNKGLNPDLVPRYGFGATPDFNMTSQMSYDEQVNKLINWGAKTVEITVFPKGQTGGQPGQGSLPITNESMDVIKQLVNINNISLGIHAPYSTGGTNQIIDIIHDPSSVIGEDYKKATEDTIKNLITVADNTNAKWINFHTTFNPWIEKQGGLRDRPTVDKAKIYDLNLGEYQTVDRRKIKKEQGLVWETDPEVADRVNQERKNLIQGQIASDIYNFRIHHSVFVEDEISRRIGNSKEMKEAKNLKEYIENLRDLSNVADDNEKQKIHSAMLASKKELSKLNEDLNAKQQELEDELTKNPAFYPASMVDKLVEGLSQYKPYLDIKTLNDVEEYMKEHYSEFKDGKSEYLKPIDNLKKEVEELKNNRKKVLGNMLKEDTGVLPWRTAITELGAINLVNMAEKVSEYEKEEGINNKVKLFVENPDIRFLGDVETTADMVKKAQDKLISMGRSDLAERLGMNLDTSHANSMWGMEYVDDNGREQRYDTVMKQWESLKKNDGLLNTIRHMHLNDSPAGVHMISPMGVPEEFGGMGVKGAETILSDLKNRGDYDKMQILLESGALSGVGFKKSMEEIDKNNVGGYYYTAPVVLGMPTFASPSFYSDPLFMGQNQQGESNSYFKMTPDFKFF